MLLLDFGSIQSATLNRYHDTGDRMYYFSRYWKITHVLNTCIKLSNGRQVIAISHDGEIYLISSFAYLDVDDVQCFTWHAGRDTWNQLFNQVPIQADDPQASMT